MQFVQFYAARADTGAVLPYARATVLLTGTSTEAALFDAEGEAIDNPLTADGVGALGFAANDGVYDVEIVSADGTYSAPRIQKLQVVDLSGVVGTITSGRKGAPTWAAAAAMSFTGGELVEVPATDTGTHTDPISGLVVPNTGVFRYKTGSPSGLERIYAIDLGVRDAALLAQAWAESDTAPAGPGTKSAKTLAAEVAAAIAGIPVGAGVLRLASPPGDNYGQTGVAAFDESGGVLYTSKSATGWGIGIKLSDGSIITRDGLIDDLALGTLPSGVTTTRAQSTTNLLAGDVGTTYATIASATAVQHPSLGLLSFPQSEQFAPDPTGPGNGTITPTHSFQVGKVCVRINGAGTLTSVAGTAAGTGYGAITEASGVQTITLTTAGTIGFSLSGSDANTLIQIEQSPLFPTTTVPTPFMPTAGTRDADRIANTGALKNALAAPQGTIIWDVRVPVNKTNNTILGINTSTAILQATGNSRLQYFDGTNFSEQLTTGTGDFRNTMRVGMTWRSGRIAFMGGSRLPTQFAATLLAITAARMGSGAATSDLYGQLSLAGGIERYQIIDRATVTSGGDALEFYDLVSEIERPTIADFQNWDASDPLPVFKGKVAQLAAGTITSSPVVCTGPSHTAGVTGFANSWPKKLADRWAAAGLPAHTRSYFATNGAVWSSGTNDKDSRATYTGPAPSLEGKSLGGECIRLSNGTAFILTWTEAGVKLIVVYYTDTGRGSFTVNAGGGPITPDEGGSSNISTNAAAGIAFKTFTYAGGSTTWTITSTGTVDLAGAFDPTGIPVINGGRSGFTAVDMSNGALIPQSSYLLPLSTIPNLALVIMSPDNTNSANPVSPVALTTYRSAVQTQLDYAIGRGCDVIVLTDPMTAPQLTPEGTQQVYAGIVTLEAKRRDLPLFALRRWAERYGYAAVHNSGFYAENNITAGLHFGSTANDWLIADPMADAILAALGMEQ